jgi:hypothetical protein
MELIELLLLLPDRQDFNSHVTVDQAPLLLSLAELMVSLLVLRCSCTA